MGGRIVEKVNASPPARSQQGLEASLNASDASFAEGLQRLEALRAEIRRGQRRLAEPLLCRRRVGVPEWLTEHSAQGPPEAPLGVVGGGASSSSGDPACPKDTSLPPSPRRLLAAGAGPPSFAALPEAAEPAGGPEEDAASTLAAGEPDGSPPGAAPAGRPDFQLPLSARLPHVPPPAPVEESTSLTSRALASKRRQHSRLRWPRLAPPGSPTARAEAQRKPGAGRLPPLSPRAPGEADPDAQQAGKARQPAFEGFGPIHFDPGSVFYNTQAASLTFSWPSRPQAGHDSRMDGDAARPDGAPGSQRAGEGEKSSLFNSRKTPYQDVVVGATATERARRSGVQQRRASEERSSWHFRQPPVSSVIANKARVREKPGTTYGRAEDRRGSGALARGAANVSGPLLNFEQWGLDDDYMASLFRAMEEQSLAQIESINLSENRLTSQGAEWLNVACHALVKLKVLNLAHNRLGETGGMTIARLVRDTPKSLAELELAGNAIGDRACAELCDALGVSRPALTHLGLAGNGLGAQDAAGEALGLLAAQLQRLRSLDLHWNRLRGHGATELCRGVYENNCTVGGQLLRLDLSWNMLGEDANGAATRTAKVLSSLFADGGVMFHLDLSYNCLVSSDCQILAEGLKSNHTLFGIHMSGNEATVDDQGFIVPRPGALALARGGPLSRLAARCGDTSLQNQVNTINDLVRSVPSSFEILAKTNSPQRRPLGPRECAAWASVERDVGCCWLCNNWVEQEVSYIPGWSGPEKRYDEVVSVFVYFSIDSFTTPTALSVSEEPFSKRLFSDWASRGSTMKPHASAVKRTSSGRVCRWAAKRMLPPTAHQLEVVFQVNGKFVVANDMPKRDLATPKTLAIARPRGQRGSGEPSGAPTAGLASEEAAAASRRGSGLAETGVVHTVNLVTPAYTALKNFQHGIGNTLLFLEEPSARGEAAVLPRQILSRGGRVVREPWAFEESSFAGLAKDSQELLAAAFDHDWGLSKLPQFFKTEVAAAAVRDVLRPRYLELANVFASESLRNHSSSRRVAGLGMQDLKDILGKCDPRTPGAAAAHQTADVETMFAVSNVLRKDVDKTCFEAMPEMSLARFQFLEAFVRVAVHRFLDADSPDHAAAVSELLERLSTSMDFTSQRQSLHEHLFREECDLLYRDCSGLLEAVYEAYRTKLCYPGRDPATTGLTFGAWLLLCDDAEVAADGLTPRKVASAFALGRQHHVEDVESFRHMELSLQEFLVALGGLVALKGDFDPAELGDMSDGLAELFIENMAEALKKVSAGASDQSASLKMKMGDPKVKPVLDFVMRTFRAADADNSATIGGQEFRRAFAQPGVLSELADLGIRVEDVGVLYRQIDADGSGDLSLDEMLHAFAALHSQMRELERAVTWLRGAFVKADRDGSGTLDFDEFRTMMSKPGTMKKLESMGIVTDEVDSLFQEILLETRGPRGLLDDVFDEAGLSSEPAEVTADQLVAAFLKIRDPGRLGDRGFAFLRSVFQEADDDGDGALSRGEIQEVLDSDRVACKLEQLGLPVPDWLAIHDELDADGDGCLSWEELQEGIGALWAAEIERRQRSAQATSFAAKDLRKDAFL